MSQSLNLYDDVVERVLMQNRWYARTMKTIYENLEEEYGDKASQVFFVLMASFSYGQIEGIKIGILWGIIANIPPAHYVG